MAKPKAAFYWCSSCGGCEEAVVDLNEFILDVTAQVDIILWPVALDFKYSDVRAMKDKEILVTFINGGIRTSEQEEISRLLRAKSQIMISFGACSQLGGIPGLANFKQKKDILSRAYIESESTVNPQKKLPKVKSKYEDYNVEIPEFYDRVYATDQIIDIDYYIPGCPPTPEVIQNAILALLGNKLPVKGSILTENKSLCHDCKRNETRPEKVLISEFKRPYEIIDNGKCFLEQGVICLGPATRTGCGNGKCIQANMPCRGCFGPTDNVMESGAKALSALASIISSKDEKEITELIKTIADPSGLFYRYSLPKSLLEKSR